MRRLVFSLVCLGSALASPAFAEVRLCLTPTRLANDGQDRHYRFDGRLSGHTAEPGPAYGIVGRDAFGNVWVQNGTLRDEVSGSVRFGVLNVSTYPLSFEVVAMDRDKMTWFRNRARVSRALDADERGWIRPLTDQAPCRFVLEDEAPVTDTCRC